MIPWWWLLVPTVAWPVALAILALFFTRDESRTAWVRRRKAMDKQLRRDYARNLKRWYEGGCNGPRPLSPPEWDAW
jgi:hypothetical protein